MGELTVCEVFLLKSKWFVLFDYIFLRIRSSTTILQIFLMFATIFIQVLTEMSSLLPLQGDVKWAYRTHSAKAFKSASLEVRAVGLVWIFCGLTSIK